MSQSKYIFNMVIDTSEIKVGWQINTEVGTFEILHLFIGQKKGRMYSLTTLSCPVYEYEGKVGRNSSIERLTLFYDLPHLAKVSITTTHYLCWRWSNRPRFSQGEDSTSLSHVWQWSQDKYGKQQNKVNLSIQEFLSTFPSYL